MGDEDTPEGDVKPRRSLLRGRVAQPVYIRNESGRIVPKYEAERKVTGDGDRTQLDIASDKILNDLNNPEFADYVRKDLIKGTDVIYESASTQVGKTKLMCILLWYCIYKLGKQVVLVVDNKNADVSQTTSRMIQFNSSLRQMGIKGRDLDYFYERNPSTGIFEDEFRNAILESRVIILTIHPERYRKIDLVGSLCRKFGKELTVIYDEADQSVASVAPVEEGGVVPQVKEEIGRKFIAEFPQTQFLYITATAFAVENSRERTEGRRLVLREVPTNMYAHRGLEYRDFRCEGNIINFTHCLESVKNLFKGRTEDEDELIKILSESIEPVDPKQPNIILINASRKNDPKNYLMRRISARLPGKFHVCAFVGGGVDEIKKSQRIIDFVTGETKEVELIVNVPTGHIGEYLQGIKDRRIREGDVPGKPIIIISTNLASRAQTFKSQDNDWIMTHFLLDLTREASMETTIQALRGNGQYLPTAPYLRMYMSREVYDKIVEALINKMEIMKAVKNRQGGSIRDAVLAAPQLRGSVTPYSRPGIDDIKVEKTDIECTGRGRTMEEVMELIRYQKKQHNIDLPVITLTKRYREISMSEVKSVLGGHTLKRGLPPSVQTDIRKKLKGICVEKGWIPPEAHIQIAGYYGAREQQINQLKLFKPSNFDADVIALGSDDTEFVTVVVYVEKEIPPNSIVVWHTTMDDIYFYFNVEETEKIAPLADLSRKVMKPVTRKTKKVEVENKAAAWIDALDENKETSRNLEVQVADRGIPIDAYLKSEKVVFKFLYNFQHGNLDVVKADAIDPETGLTYGEINANTMTMLRLLKEAGYEVYYVWESQWDEFVESKKGKVPFESYGSVMEEI